MLIEPDPRPEPIVRPNRVPKKTFGLGSIFRRTFDFQGLAVCDAPTSFDGAHIPEPTRPAPTVEPATMYVLLMVHCEPKLTLVVNVFPVWMTLPNLE